MIRVYLSYAPAAAQRAEELRRILLAQGYRPWIDPEPPGVQLWHHEIDGAIQNANALILLVTREAVDSIYVTYECALALGRGIPLFAIIIDDVPLHPRLLHVPRYAMGDFNDENRFWDHFIADLSAHLEPRAASADLRLPPIAAAPTPDRDLMPEAEGDWIVVRQGPVANAMFRLERAVVNLGRDSANDIVIEDLRVSRFHLRILRQGDSHIVEDMGSVNGTRLNGVPAHAATALKPGDVISLGEQVILTYERVESD